MAAEGMRFTDFYMASPVCSPSRGAMLTGCYPPRIGFGEFSGRWVLFPGAADGLHPSEMTFASMLKREGYATQIVGKWHCGDQPPFLPTSHGFDEYFGIPYSNDMGRQGGRDRGYPPLPLMSNDEVIQAQPDQAAITERYVEKAVTFMRKNQDKPFLIYFAHMHVHLPLIVAQRFVNASRNGNYGAAVAAIDWATGALLAELKRLGLDDDTIVMFTSDNGSRLQGQGGSNGSLRGAKGTTWEGGMRLPLIARWPGKIPAGETCTKLCASIDLLPTFAKLSGAAVPHDRTIDGRDISPLMFEGDAVESPRKSFYYYFRNDFNAVRDDRWKLFVERAGGSRADVKRDPVLELYDLRSDIGETSNVADQHPDVVQRLMQLVEEARTSIGDAAQQRAGSDVRPAGKVDNPQTLTTFDPEYPYFAAEYDTNEFG